MIYPIPDWHAGAREMLARGERNRTICETLGVKSHQVEHLSYKIRNEGYRAKSPFPYATRALPKREPAPLPAPVQHPDRTVKLVLSYLGESGLSYMPVSLARVPCLERPLPPW